MPRTRCSRPDEVEQLARTPREERIAALYRLYEQRLQAAGALDFDDLLLRVVRLFETAPRGARVVPDALDARPRRRVPGHQPRAVPHRPAPDPGAPEPLRGRRSRPVRVPLARRRPAEHPRLREGLPGLPRRRRSTRTTAPPSASSTSPPPSSPTTSPGRTSGSGPRTSRASAHPSTAHGTRPERPASWRSPSARRTATASTTATWPSSTAPTPSRA